MCDRLLDIGRRAAGLVLALVIASGGLSPESVAAIPPDSSSEPEKYWLFFEERPAPAPASQEGEWTQPVAPSYLRRLRERGIRPLVRSRWFHAVSARLSSSARETVAALPFVRTVRPVATYRSPTTASVSTGSTARRLSGSVAPSPPKSPLQPGASHGPLSRIHALPPLRRGLDGHGVRVGFLDAHFNGLRHPAFASLRRDGRLAALRTFTENWQAGNHGMGVVSVAAGRAAGSLLGPAHGATVLGATTEYTQFERNVEEDNFVAGLEWLHRRGVDVVNVSIGYTTFDEGQHSYAPADLDGDTALTTRAVDRAAQLGVTVVVAAGNSGCATPDSCWFYVNTPADADSAITVGAIEPDSSLASFSARGPTADGRRKPDVVVQGSNVVAAWGNDRYARLGGTSFSSPQVTGVVAQMLQVNPSLGPIQVRRLLRQTASQAHDPDTTRGWGIVNAEAAIRLAEWRARATPPPTLQASSPYRPVDRSSLIVPVSAPAGTSTLWISLVTPLGRRVLYTKRPAHPGPNRLSVSVQTLPPGRYRYRIRTNTGHHATGPLTITP